VEIHYEEDSFMIEVIFPLHDLSGKYSKILGVAICSLLSNTKNSINVHIIHDDTITESNKQKLCQIVKERNQSITFHFIDTKHWEIDPSIYQSYTIGTLLRLKIPEIFKGYHKILYLDSDIVFNVDIEDVWEINIEDSYVAACPDRFLAENDISIPVVELGLVKRDEYFNAGVMLLNLDKIASLGNLFNICCEKFKESEKFVFADQDILNELFQSKVKFLDEKYNSLTVLLRNQNLPIEKRVYHFAGDNPKIVGKEQFDMLFFKYLFDTPWGTWDEIYKYLRNQVDPIMDQRQTLLRILLAKRKEHKIIMWGAKSVMLHNILRFVPMCETDYLVDSNKTLWGKTVEGYKVFDPDKLLNEVRGKCFVIVLSHKYYDDIKRMLENMGLRENSDFVDGRILSPYIEEIVTTRENDLC